MDREIALADPRDWQRLRDNGLTTVVDPMVYRAAELFLGGRRGASNANETWAALSANLGGLATFFDAIILHDRLPIFDYAITFPEAPHVAAGVSVRLVPAVNAEEEVLTPVRVGPAAYTAMKEAALDELRVQPPIDEDVRASVVAELDAFDYRWAPGLDGSEESSEEQRRFDAYLYGGLLFSAYAQELRGTHVLQPKRARCFAQVAVGAAADDGILFSRLAQLPEAAPDAVSNALDVPPIPSFLPLLLRQAPNAPGEMLETALGLRRDADVAAYREWRKELLEELARGGNALDKRAELEEIRAALARKAAGASIPTKLSVSWVALAIPVVKLETEIKAEVRPRAAWGWSVRKVRGDHRKVLMRLIAAKESYRRLDLALSEIWQRG